MAAGTAQVGTLRLRSTAGDTPAVRLAASAWLGGADLHPGGLPPSAVLIVRRMADPLPGKLLAGGPAPPDPAWERAARASLDGFHRRAARPARGPVPPGAEAVLFADEAEMLACLARDLAQSNALACWWWALVLRRLGAWDLPRLFLQEPARVPALLAHLTQRGHAAEVCTRLSEAEAATVLEAVARAYGAPDLAAIATVPRTGSAGILPAGGRGAATAAGRAAILSTPPAHPIKPPLPAWRKGFHTIPDIGRLAPANRVLLAAALALFEEPAKARSGLFTAEVRAWWEVGAPVEEAARRAEEEVEDRVAFEDGARGGGPSLPVPLSHPHSLPPGEGAPPPAENRSELAPLRQIESPPPGLPPAPTVPLPRGREVTAEDRGEIRAGLEAKPLTNRNAEAVSRAPKAAEPIPSVARPEPSVGVRAAVSTETAVEMEEEAQGPNLEEGAATEIAGLFYLVNLMTSLDLPDCFEEDWHLASEVGAWGVLDAIARALLRNAAQVAGDPVWRVLALLAGRELDEPPGRGYMGGLQFRAPDSWRVTHEVQPLPHGVEMLPLGAESQHLEAPYGPLGLGGEGLARWIDLALPHLRLRLAEGLGLDRARPEELAPLLLLRPGRVHVTPTHVDVVMDLATVALPVRICGLDRDPGWVPAFGRVIQFHFL